MAKSKEKIRVKLIELRNAVDSFKQLTSMSLTAKDAWAIAKLGIESNKHLVAFREADKSLREKYLPKPGENGEKPKEEEFDPEKNPNVKKYIEEAQLLMDKKVCIEAERVVINLTKLEESGTKVSAKLLIDLEKFIDVTE